MLNFIKPPFGISDSSRQNIVLLLAAFPGTSCSTSQCSTILPFSSNRKMSMHRLGRFALIEHEVVEPHRGLLVALESIGRWHSALPPGFTG
jgi:hypothetical protein